MSEIHLRRPGFTYSARGPFNKNKETNKQTNKQKKEQVIQDIFIKTNKVKLEFNMIWLMEISKI